MNTSYLDSGHGPDRTSRTDKADSDRRTSRHYKVPRIANSLKRDVPV